MFFVHRNVSFREKIFPLRNVKDFAPISLSPYKVVLEELHAKNNLVTTPSTEDVIRV